MASSIIAIICGLETNQEATIKPLLLGPLYWKVLAFCFLKASEQLFMSICSQLIASLERAIVWMLCLASKRSGVNKKEAQVIFNVIFASSCLLTAARYTAFLFIWDALVKRMNLEPERVLKIVSMWVMNLKGHVLISVTERGLVFLIVTKLLLSPRCLGDSWNRNKCLVQ